MTFLCGKLQPQVIPVVLTWAPSAPDPPRLPAAALAGPLLLSLALEWAPHSLTLPRPLSPRCQGSLQAQGLCILFFPPPGMTFP